MFPLCSSGGNRPNIPAWVSEPALCSSRCSSEGSAGGLLHAGSGKRSPILAYPISWEKLPPPGFSSCRSRDVFFFHFSLSICVFVFRPAPTWTPKTKTRGPPCWKPSSITTWTWLGTWSRTAPASIMWWVPERGWTFPVDLVLHPDNYFILFIVFFNFLSGGRQVHRPSSCCQVRKLGNR